jgi:glycerate 2-kinase
MVLKDARESVLDIFKTALHAVDPYASVKRYISRVLSAYKDHRSTNILLVSFGKAAMPMAKAAIERLPADIPFKGIVLTKYGHVGDTVLPASIAVYEAGHPVPDEAGQRAALEILKLLADAKQNTLVLFLISGGGSALLVAPWEGITLEDKQRVTDELLRAGVSIEELNTVRKHISRVKGGRLAQIAYPATGISLILSDVIGDRLSVIASGPTCGDPSTFADAVDVLEKYGNTAKIPFSVMDILREGARGGIPETPKEGEPFLKNFQNIIIGSNKLATKAAKARAIELGFYSTVFSNEIHGEAKDVAQQYAMQAKELQKALLKNRSQNICLIFGGETTVTVKGSGLGGRNTELALSFALEIEGTEGITLLSAGTDGTDGPTDAAGAIVDGTTIQVARSKGLNPQSYLDRNDSYSFFKETGELLITGPTGTNVMDVQVILIGR